MSGPGALEIDVRLPLDRFELAARLVTRHPATGIFGASGAGKTSLLETVAGLRRGARGRLALDGEVWLDSASGLFVPPERRRIGYVPQDSLLFPHLDVRGNLLAGARRADRQSGASGADRLGEVAALLELDGLLDRDVAALSGGERRRVALGRALCSAPALLLLDEPLASLDLPLRRRLLPFLRRLREELTIPMLLVTHDPFEAQALCDELIVLRDGAVIASGTPREVLADPEVFTLAGEPGFENVLAGRAVPGRPGEIRLSPGALTLITRDAAGASAGDGGGDDDGGDVLVAIPASDVVLATERPRGISARNVLPARVESIRPHDGRALVTARLDGGPPLCAELTDATPAALGLETGMTVYLVIKATSCRVFGSAA